MNYTEGLIKATEFFTTAELAQKLKMNVQVITRKVQAGEIQAYKIGKEWRIPEQSVFDWLESNINSKTAIPRRTRVAAAVKPVAETPSLTSAQQSKRKYLLEYILAQFEPDREYTEAEVNRVVTRYHSNSHTIRREFVAEKMMEHINGNYRRRTGYRFSD